jgi:hypothetical protein
VSHFNGKRLMTANGIEEAIKTDPKTFFGYVNLKKKRVGYPSVMHFDGRLASGPEYQQIFINMCFPDRWKLSYVTPIFKKGNTT